MDDEDITDPKVAAQLQLPVKYGGAGLRPFHQNVSLTAFYATRAATADCFEKARVDVKGWYGDSFNDEYHTESAAEHASVHKALLESGVEPRALDEKHNQIVPVSSDPNEIQAFHAAKKVPHLQRLLQKQVDKKNARSFHQKLGEGLSTAAATRAKARMLACAAPGARRAMVKPPLNDRFSLSNSEFIMSWKMRLGLLPCSRRDLPTKCACGGVLLDLPRDHLLTCREASALGRMSSHNLCRDALIACAQDAGYQTEKEPRVIGHDERPDAKLIDHQGRLILVDVSFVQPSAASYSSAASRTALAAAELREKTKKKKFVHLAQEVKAQRCAGCQSSTTSPAAANRPPLST